MRKFNLLSVLIAFVCCIGSLNAQLYNYTNNISGIPASVAANVSGSNLTRVNGTVLATGCADGFNSSSNATNPLFNLGMPNVEFTLTPDAGYQLDVTAVTVDGRHNNKGPTQWRLAYSTDGGTTWNNNGADLAVTAVPCATSTAISWDMPDFSSYNSVMVRIYAYSAQSAGAGVGTIKNVVLSGSVSFADVDGDGYTSDADCNDFDAAINPGMSETCNGIDDNCDGNIDEGVLTTYYADADGDTYGDASNSTMACSMPEGYVTDNTDCNDSDAAVNPGATEVCNGVDDNCDGNIDEGVQTTFYADADGDGYGDASSSLSACSAPEGYVTDNTDCNDGDAAVNPGATEVCNGIDDNCDGNIDEDLTFDTWYADADGDGYGDAVMSATTCDGAPEGYVADNTDCNDGDAAVNPGATEVCNGIDDNCDGNTDEGVETTFYADADGDGYGDAGSTTSACSAPEGYVADNTDCNDGDAAVNPGATEVCNGIDDNCDGNIDEDLTFDTWYADADGDGYGDAAMSATTCDGAPEGFVADNTDCNDADAVVNPGATEVCNGIDDNCDGNTDEGVETTFYADADGDGYGDAGSTTSACSAPEGYVADNTDCNDADAAVNPGATEVCNGVDDNCDGNIDEGVETTFYADADGDGYGDAGSSVSACSAPEGYVGDNTDCNDSDAAVNPGATEVCNGVDDNCDGNIDEGVETTFYADADGDGYGDAGSTTSACSPPEGYVTDNTDCNDADAAVNPGATEVCNGVDDNCDSNIDEGVETTFYADADGDGYGDAGSTTSACSAPEGYVADNTDCNDGDASVNPGATEVCNGVDDNCDGNIDEGVETTFYADADGDGYGDAGSSVSACSAPEGYVGDNTDCNDADAAVNPGMTEVCNGVDDNCDGNIDEGVTTTSYNDADLDGFGDAGMSNTGCTIPEGYILDNTDCNDASASIYPGAIEVCGNGIDDDCDGAIDVFSTIAALGSTTICSGQSVTMESTAAGSGYGYQWKRNGSIIAGATSASYAATLAGNYTLYIYKPYCYNESASIIVSVLPVPSAVVAAPDGLDICALPSLKLKANVGAGLTYQWYMDGNAIGGATSSIYFATAVGDYYVVVTNASGCSTQSATVTVFSGCRFGEEAAQAKMQVNPNPSNGNITIVGTFGTSVSNEATITVMNIAGERVAEFGTTIINGVINETISIPNVAGVYMITVVVDGNRLTTQAIITE